MITRGTLLAESCNIFDNQYSCNIGGGVSVDGSATYVQIDDCSINNNGALLFFDQWGYSSTGCPGGGVGGGLYYTSSSDNAPLTTRHPILVVSRCLFANNIAYNGGGIYISGRSASQRERYALTSVVFTANTALYDRGSEIYAETYAPAPYSYLLNVSIRPASDAVPAIQAVGPLKWRCPLGVRAALRPNFGRHPLYHAPISDVRSPL